MSADKEEGEGEENNSASGGEKEEEKEELSQTESNGSSTLKRYVAGGHFTTANERFLRGRASVLGVRSFEGVLS